MNSEQAKPSRPAKTTGRWGSERRLEFIDFRLAWEGRLNRSDLMSFFGISVPQASLDIARYKELAPDNLAYDARSRIYVSTDAFKPLYATSSSQRYLSELLACEAGVLDAEASFIGWRPSLAQVPMPRRRLEARVLFALLRAIREEKCVEVLYQSMQRAEPGRRTLSPHALAHDGFRLHVRAFCHEREEFRDFVVARVLELTASPSAWCSGAEDVDWQTPVELVIVPNPKLPKAHRRAIELDYGMVDGQTSVSCRKALAFYTLRHLGLQEDGGPPEARQIVLKNRRQLQSVLRLAETV